MDSRRIISGFVFVFLILIGKANLSLDQGGVHQNSRNSAGLICKVKQQSPLIANAPLLLEETEVSFKSRPDNAFDQTYLSIDSDRSFTPYFWINFQEVSTSPPSVTPHGPPRYILFHALIIPS